VISLTTKRNVLQRRSQPEMLEVGVVRRDVDVLVVDGLALVVVVLNLLHQLRLLKMSTGHNKTPIQTTSILKVNLV